MLTTELSSPKFTLSLWVP